MLLKVTTANGQRQVQLVREHPAPSEPAGEGTGSDGHGREGDLDLDSLWWLLGSVARHLEAGGAAAGGEEGHSAEVHSAEIGGAEIGGAEALGEPPAVAPSSAFLGARDLGGPWLLDGLWRRLGIQRALCSLLAAQAGAPATERIIFALAACVALAPSSSLGFGPWLAQKAFIADLPPAGSEMIDEAFAFAAEHHSKITQVVSEALGLRDGLMFLALLPAAGAAAPSATAQARETKVGYAGPTAVVVSQSGIPVRLVSLAAGATILDAVPLVKRDLERSGLGRMLVAHNPVGSAGVPVAARGEHYVTCERLGGDPGDRQAVLSAGVARVRRVRLGEGRPVRRFTVVYNFALARPDDEITPVDLVRGLDHLRDTVATLHRLGRPPTAELGQLRRSEQLRVQGLVTWLALLLVRRAELQAGQTWGELETVVGPIQIGITRVGGAEVLQSTRLTSEQAELFRKLALGLPPAQLTPEGPDG